MEYADTHFENYLICVFEHFGEKKVFEYKLYKYLKKIKYFYRNFQLGTNTFENFTKSFNHLKPSSESIFVLYRVHFHSII